MPKLPLLTLIAVVIATTASMNKAWAALPVLATAQPAWPQSRDGLNRRVRIHNQTGWTMDRLLIADNRSHAWRGDILETQNVATGASTVVTVDDGSGACVYLFRAEFTNGQTLERTEINVCEIADYYFTR